jgi:hypothetical protein
MAWVKLPILKNLFDGAALLRKFPIFYNSVAPVSYREYNKYTKHYIRHLGQNPHPFEYPLKKISGSIKNVCPGYHQAKK